MPKNCVAKVLILKADKFYGRAIQSAVSQVFSDAEVILAHRVEQAANLLTAEPCDLLLTGVQMPDGDVIDRLSEWTIEPKPARSVLVITGRREPRILAALRRLPIGGVFDPSVEEPEAFHVAIRRVTDGLPYWSESAVACAAAESASQSAAPSLTPTEQLIFAVIGDGCDDVTAANRLGMRPSSVRSIRRQLHSKLGVQHKGELVRLAAELGYVCIGAHGVIRPGFSQLSAAKQWRQARRGRECPAKCAA